MNGVDRTMIPLTIKGLQVPSPQAGYSAISVYAQTRYTAIPRLSNIHHENSSATCHMRSCLCFTSRLLTSNHQNRKVSSALMSSVPDESYPATDFGMASWLKLKDSNASTSGREGLTSKSNGKLVKL